jgi:hypothetical protein
LPYQAGPGPVKPLPLIRIGRYAVSLSRPFLRWVRPSGPGRVAPHPFDPWLLTESDRRGNRGGPSRVSVSVVPTLSGMTSCPLIFRIRSG